MKKFIFLLLIGVHTTTVSALNHEEQLRQDQFVKQTVSKKTRPVLFHNETVQIHFSLFVAHVADLDVKTETLTTNCWLVTGWTDHHFKWNPEDYGGIEYIPVATDQVWTPDIYLINNANGAEANPIGDIPVLVTNNGWVWWFPPATFRSICPLDLTKFPYDEHICKLMFTSWSHWEDELFINVGNEHENPTDYLMNEHNEWEIVSSHGNRSQYIFPAYPDYPVHFVTFYIQLRRRAPYYSLVLIVPTMVALITTLVTFWIPPTASEKYFVGGLNIFTATVLLAHIFWVVPRSGSNVPGIVFVLGNTLLFSGLSLVITIATSSISRRNPNSTAPNFVKSFLNNHLISTVLCFQSGTQKMTYSGNAQLLINEEDEADEQPEASTVIEWFKLAVAIDRMFFLMYCFAFLVILSTAFS